jgi:hypothetical protein
MQDIETRSMAAERLAFIRRPTPIVAAAMKVRQCFGRFVECFLDFEDFWRKLSKTITPPDKGGLAAKSDLAISKLPPTTVSTPTHHTYFVD